MMSQRIACDLCHKRKIQCIPPKSASSASGCEWCIERGTPCTLNRRRGRKKKKNSKRKIGDNPIDSITERIKRIEESTARIKALREKEVRENAALASLTEHTKLRSSEFESALLSIEENSANASSPNTASSQPQSSVKPGAGTRQSSGQIYFSGLELGTVDSRSGIPCLSAAGKSWIFDATGQWPSFESLGSTGGQSTMSTQDQPTSSTRVSHDSVGQKNELPRQSVVKSLLQAYCMSDLRLIFPVVDHALFEETIKTAYDIETDAHYAKQVTAKACVLAFVCFMGIYAGDTAIDVSIDVDLYATKSNGLVSNMLEDPSLTLLQTLLMLGLYHTASGRFQTGVILHATMCRVGFMLAAHILIPGPVSNNQSLSPREREDRQLRRAFWLCFVFDKDIALRTGQPCLMTDEFCDLTLPLEYTRRFFVREAQMNDQRWQPSGDCDDGILFPCDLKLSIIKSKTCRLLYSAEAMSKSDTDLLRSIRELDEEIENWRVSLPLNFIPSLSVATLSTSPLQLSRHKNLHHIKLHLEYHHLMSVVHHASGRCKSLQKDGTYQAWISILESSLELSVEASRSTLIYLSAVVHGLASEAVWNFIFYPIAALVILFFNILRDPLNKQTANDLDIISLTRDVIKSMPGNRFRPQDAYNLGKLDAMIAELGRLGQCAINKAQRELV